MSLETPSQIRELQIKLYRKAKNEPEYRFYLLYDKVYREDILAHAYRVAKANQGAPGVDEQSFEDIESEGLEEWLTGIREQLHKQTYKPQPVRRVMIPKPGGGERALGIPTIRDRVVQTATKLVIEPILEADLEPNVYGYRPKRSAQDAIREVHKQVRAGYTDVVDADLSKYFDTIPHRELMRSVARRIVDRKVLHLIKMWLRVPVEERDENGKKRWTGGKNQACGTPQGGVISPLLANLYINRMLKGWRKTQRGEQFQACVINYADDFVILSRGKAVEALEWTRQVVAGLGLTLNEAKTSIKQASKESFNFLGYTFGPHFHWKDGRQYTGASPSNKSVARIKEKVGEILRPDNVEPWETVRDQLNRRLRGWKAYFSYGSLLRAYQAVDLYVEEGVRNFLKRRHKVQSRGTTRFSGQVIFGELGVTQLRRVSVKSRS
jgi:RNA-directed DNA polymerase